jgi:hypothetical protein
MMSKHSRRQFIGQLFATSIGSTGLSRTASAKIDQLNEGLAELCVIAREPGNLSNAVVDVGPARLDLSILHSCPNN